MSGVMILMLALLTASCASRPPATPADDCLLGWSDFRDAVKASGVRDAQYRVIPGFPFLRTNRLLAHLAQAQRETDPAAATTQAWLQAAFQLGHESAQVEWSNLPARARHRLRDAAGAPRDLASLLQCAAGYFQQHPKRDALVRKALERAHVPDAYSTLQRAGGYAIARHLSLMGVRDLHEEMRARVGKADPDARKLAVSGPAQPRALDRTRVADILQTGRRRSAIGVHQFEDEERRQLFAQFAPVLRLGSATASDLIGEIAWDERGRLEVRVGSPSAYQHVSHTVWRGEVLAQLNYVFWFPRRAQRSMLDPYAGKLDGLIWRVTLRPDGRVLAYDSIHPCGCYHTVYLPKDAPPARSPGFLEEPVMVYPQQLPDPYQQRLQLQISAIDHHVIDIRGVDAQAVLGKRPYKFLPYDQLRSLPHMDGTRASIFGEDGLIPGTERGERAFLWPLGVVSPGQMRQWGHHATAFVGRRHFDDPKLLETLLSVEGQNPQAGEAVPQ